MVSRIQWYANVIRSLICLCGFRWCGDSDGVIFFRQREANTNTIENTLFDAMVKAGAVSKENSDDPVKVSESCSLR